MPDDDTSTDVSDNSDNEVELASSDSVSTTTSVPADIAQSRAQSPVQPVLRSYPQTMFGKRKNAKNRSFNHHWYTLFPFIEYSASRNAVFCFPCRFFPHPTTSTEQVFTSVGFRHAFQLPFLTSGPPTVNLLKPPLYIAGTHNSVLMECRDFSVAPLDMK